MASRRPLAGVLLSAGSLIAGCNAILGIEDLSPGPRAGNSGVASGGSTSGAGPIRGGGGSSALGGSGRANAGNAGAMGGVTSAGSGATTTVGPNGGQGGTSSQGGTSASGGTTSEGSGGMDSGVSGDDGGGAGGANGTGGGGSFDGTVSGKIFNLWGYPMAGVTVTVSGVSATVVTQTDGSFTAAGVTPPYDVSFVVRATNGSSTALATQGWLFRGVRRADPTFRVYRGGSEISGDITVTQTGAPMDPALRFGVSVASPYGRLSRSMEAPGIAYASVPLAGPTTAQGVAHLLSFFEAANGLPTSYSAYGTRAVAINTDVMASQDFDMTPPTVGLRAGSVTGTVVSTGSGARMNSAWVQFASHGVIQLAQYAPTASGFAYTVPELPDATFTVAASQGDRFVGPYAIAHENGLVAGGSASIAIPAPSIVSAPADGASLGPATVFQWSNTANVSVLRIQSLTRWIYVVTSEDNTTIPSALYQAVGINSGNLEFRVETHGGLANMDAATAPRGFIDEFATLDVAPDHPEPGDGSFTFSELFSGTFAP